MEVEVSSGSMTRKAGISESLVGAKNIHLAISTLPPGASATPHYHVNCETGIYIMNGNGRFLTGPNLDEDNRIKEGDFIHVPSGAVHQPINDSDTEDLVMVVARNTPTEKVIEYEKE